MTHHSQLFYVACMFWGIVAVAESAGRGFFNRQPTICGATSWSSVTQLNNPDAGRQGDCSYTIRANSRRVCQLRIDINMMNLAQPTTTVEKPYPHCIHDALLVEGLSMEFCGQNDGHHIYVPWNVQRLRDTKRITVRIANRRTTPGLPAATWQLRVSQIECQESGWLGRRDSALRAPAGCLQYFNEPSGVFESFNFNGRLGPYLGAQTYAICFRRRPGDAELRLNAEFFEMSQLVPNGPGHDTDCVSQVVTPQSQQDFLAIREASFKTSNGPNLVANRFCGTGIAPGQLITSRAPGPFIVQFSADEHTSAHEKGFRFKYTVQ